MTDSEIKMALCLLLLFVVTIFIVAAQDANDGPLTPVDVPTSVEE